MSLPDDFSPWEHLQSTLMQVHNRIVREEFSDIGEEDWEPEITTSRGSLRLACTMTDDDSAIMTELRMLLFYIILRKASDMQIPVYGIPVTGFQEARRFQPQIELFFQEDAQDVEKGFHAVTASISFRLMHENSQTLTHADAMNYATRIRELFATGGGFTWNKGRTQVTYTDRVNGYALRLLCRSSAEGRRVIERILEIQGHSPNWKNLNKSDNEEPAERYPIVPPQQQIYGKERRLPRQRPVASVRFKYALLHLWGLPEPIILVDKGFNFKRTLIHVA